MVSVFTAAFIAALVVTSALRVWLALRHMRHIAGHRNAVPAPFAGELTLDAHRRAADYNVEKIRLALLSGTIDLLMLVGLTLAGGLDQIWHLTGLAFAGPILHGTAFMAVTVVVSSLVSLPVSLYATFGIEARYGFNHMTLSLFVRDALRGWALGAALGLPLIALVLWLMQASGALWWLWVWLVWSAFNLLMVAIYPTWIAPLFNRFTPLEDEALKTRIEALLARTGFRSQGVFVMDGSTRSSHGNAYFTGFGAAKRIVFFDTLLDHLTPEEIEAVLAHELGHFRMKHVLQRIVLTFLLSLAALYLLGVLIAQPWFYQGLGVHSMGPSQALVLFFLALPCFTFPLTPLISMLSRRHEFQADDFAARETDAGMLVSALVKLYRDNASTLTPDPVYSAFYDSHPPAAIRIAHLKGQA